MAKTVRKTDFRVLVRPRSPGDFGVAYVGGIERSEERERALCEKIADQIRRHVDDLPSRGIGGGGGNRGVRAVHDTEDVCEHCGARWTEVSDEYNGGCCEADMSGAEAVEVER